MLCVAYATITNTTAEITAGIAVSNPAYSAGKVKKKMNLIIEPTSIAVIAAGIFAFFQNNPNVSGANAPANMMSNAKIR